MENRKFSVINVWLWSRHYVFNFLFKFTILLKLSLGYMQKNFTYHFFDNDSGTKWPILPRILIIFVWSLKFLIFREKNVSQNRLGVRTDGYSFFLLRRLFALMDIMALSKISKPHVTLMRWPYILASFTSYNFNYIFIFA